VKRFLSSPDCLLLLLLVLGALTFSGCATAESENTSERPWSTPQSWENGLPGGMFNQSR
jgi:hypothetical protein